MYVSVYSSYVAPQLPKGETPAKGEKPQESSEKFRLPTPQEQAKNHAIQPQILQLSTDASSYRFMVAREFLDSSSQKQDLLKKLKKEQDATRSYAESQKPYRHFSGVFATLDELNAASLSTPANLPAEALKTQEFFAKKTAINAYEANDTYYKIYKLSQAS